jgi:hypothetical protein
MSASTWAAASLEAAPAGLEADGDAEVDGGDEAELEERVGLDGDEEDGDVDEDGDEEGPPAPGCREWARDGVGCADCGTDGLAVTAPNGWPAHGGASWAAASTAGPMAPASAADAADPAAAWAGAQEAGAGRSVTVPDAAGAAGAFPLTR